MRTTRIGFITLGLALTFSLGACGGGGTITKSGPPKAMETSGSSTGDSSPETGITIPGSSETLPDLPDLGNIPGGDQLQECTDVGLLYANMSLGAVGGAEGAADAEKAAKELAAKLPDDLQDDLEIVRSAFAKVSDDIFAAGQAMSTPEFEAASKNLSDYVEKVCTPGG